MFVDVVLMGELVLNFVGLDDVDCCIFVRMVVDGFFGLTMFVVYGGGYHVELLMEYVWLLVIRLMWLKVVVVLLWLCGCLWFWIEYFCFGYVEVMRWLRVLDFLTLLWCVCGLLWCEIFVDFECYYRLLYAMFLGEWFIGDYVCLLKRFGMDFVEWLCLLYVFYYGLLVLFEGLVVVIAFGEVFWDFGCVLFVYEIFVFV